MKTLVTQAFLLAAELHANQKRKAALATGVPYLSHLMETAGMVMTSGAPETVVAAALLHDAIEDHGNATRQSIQQRLGDDVLALVEECTEPGTGGPVKAAWQERKKAALQRMQGLSMFALMILAADKLQNTRDLYRNVILRGDEAYAAFRVEKAAKLWFYSEAASEMQKRLGTFEADHPHNPLLLMTRCWLQEFSEALTFLELH
ncbi:HD domain-containing protein [Ktedonosporobacter rubrisoli]|nr:HD domain-containing protein [Ktedonosporobacter rubrisoli]